MREKHLFPTRFRLQYSKTLLKWSFLAILLISLFPFSTFAQTNLQWSKNWGGSKNDIGVSVFPTLDEGCIITGYTFSDDGDILLPKGNGDVWVAKLTATGTVQWSKTYGGFGFEKPTAILRASDGGFVLLYNSRSADYAANLGGTDCFIVKLNFNGNIVWHQSFGGTSDDFGKSIINDGVGGYYVAGNTLSSFGQSGKIPQPNAWLVHLDDQGQVIWNKTYGDVRADFFEKLILVNDNQLIIAGQSESNAYQSTNKGLSDAWLVSTDLDGNLLWVNTFGGSKKDGFKDIAVDGNNNLLAGGYTFSTDFESTGQHGSKDAFVVKTNINGQLIWSKTIGGSKVDECVSISASENNILLLNNTSSNDNDFETTLNQSNAVFSTLDSNGNFISNTFYGGSKEDAISNAALSENGSLYAIGYSQSNDGNVFENKGLSDIWLIKTIGETNEELPNVTVDIGQSIQICAGNSVEIDLEESCNTCTFQWEDGSNDVFRVLNPLNSTNYEITITETTGITSVGSIEIEVMPALELNLIETPISCKGASDGGIELSIIGGNGLYDVSWNNGSTETNLVDLASNIYQVTVVDEQSCSATANIVLTNPAEISNIAVIENIQCNGDATGQIVLNTSGGNAPYEYDWSNGAATNSISDIEEGNYSVTIMDNSGCSKAANYSINAPNALSTNVSIEPPSGSNSDGSILLIPSGGNPPYEIDWETGNQGPSLYNLSIGTYNYTLTDSYGCSMTEEVALGTTSNTELENEPISISPNPNNGTFTLKGFEGQVEVYSLDGKLVFELTDIRLNSEIELPQYIAKGIYFIKCIHTDLKTLQIEKLIVE